MCVSIPCAKQGELVYIPYNICCRQDVGLRDMGSKSSHLSVVQTKQGGRVRFGCSQIPVIH